jgi:hyperosmotically inducible periplasmic protein
MGRWVDEISFGETIMTTRCKKLRLQVLFATATVTALCTLGCENKRTSAQQELIAVAPAVPIDAAGPPVRVDAPVDARMGTVDSRTSDAGLPIPFAATIVDRNPGAADSTGNADNTKINQRDRGDTLTPSDQGNSADEIKITATIRRGISRDDTLSFNAKNAKVITVGSKVTLRGPVKSEQEKVAIEQLAKSTAGVSVVDSQLEIEK